MSKGYTNRRANRVAAMQFLYMWEANPPDSMPEVMERFFSNLPMVDEDALPPLPKDAVQEAPAEQPAGGVPVEPAPRPALVAPQPVKIQPREDWQFAEELVLGVIEHLEEIDEIIRSHTRNWDFKRIARIDLSILRLAIYEMLHRKDVPPIVSINEAIDLSKLYSNADAKRFINGILDQFKLRLNRPLRDASK
ncbi:MAG: transcription antitermination factor NusB [Verrucomicrobiota bacterium]|nr:transcription antitermination factor NusB [Verrucomicrobiota bacterium]